MALSANGSAVVADKVQLAAQAVNAAALFNQSYTFMGSKNHATSTTRGRLSNWTSAANQIPMGFSSSRQTGDTSATPIVEGTLDMDGRIMKNLVVAGLGGTFADNGRKVYATDDGTFTLTRPAAPTIPVGFVSRFVSATNANVFFFSTEVLMAIALAGGEKKTLCLGSITAAMAATGYLLGAVTPAGYKNMMQGAIVDVYAVNIRANTDADVSISVNLEINAVVVTGGVVTLAFGDALGAIKQGTAVTALNVLHEGDIIAAKGTVGTAGTATDVGTYNLYITVEPEFGL